MTLPNKPTGGKCYGSIPHLPNSRRGPGDHGVEEICARLLTTENRHKSDVIVVQEKADGGCVGVYKAPNGELIPLMRAGYPALTSPFEQHRVFHHWVKANEDRFNMLLGPRERVVGEWLLEAHGTRYNLPHEPFVVFDIFHNQERLLSLHVRTRCQVAGLKSVPEIHRGGPLSVEAAIEKLGALGNLGALPEDGPEGAVWRLERGTRVLMLAKYVHHNKVDGKYFDHISGQPTSYNTYPGQSLVDLYTQVSK